MGMVDTHGLADYFCALGALLVVLQSHLAHGVEHAAMDGLQTVANVGQSAANDDRHRVVEIRPAHLVFDVDGNDIGTAMRRATSFERELWILIVCHKRWVQAKGLEGRFLRLAGASLATL
jgi:hypothetical protein